VVRDHLTRQQPRLSISLSTSEPAVCGVSAIQQRVNSTGGAAGERNATPTTRGAGALGSSRRSGSRSRSALNATIASYVAGTVWVSRPDRSTVPGMAAVATPSRQTSTVSATNRGAAAGKS
jgi:hypothetical protein